MSGLHALDRMIGSEWPSLATEADVRRFEAVPYEERIAARSTYEALRCGASIDPATPAPLHEDQRVPAVAVGAEQLRVDQPDLYC